MGHRRFWEGCILAAAALPLVLFVLLVLLAAPLVVLTCSAIQGLMACSTAMPHTRPWLQANG